MAVWSFMCNVVLEYDRVLVLETGDSVWVKEDRETNAAECLVMTANMPPSRIFIRSCSMLTNNSGDPSSLLSKIVLL
jgi:hypothetical protein